MIQMVSGLAVALALEWCKCGERKVTSKGKWWYYFSCLWFSRHRIMLVFVTFEYNIVANSVVRLVRLYKYTSVRIHCISRVSVIGGKTKEARE